MRSQGEFTITKDEDGYKVYKGVLGGYLFTTDSLEKADKICHALEMQMVLSIDDMNCVYDDGSYKQYSDVRPREGGPYSLFCYTCRRWIPNTACYESLRDGGYSHSHFCIKDGDGIRVLAEPGEPE